MRSKVAALAAEHEVMTGLGANAEAQETDGDERESRGVKEKLEKRRCRRAARKRKKRAQKWTLRRRGKKHFKIFDEFLFVTVKEPKGPAVCHAAEEKKRTLRKQGRSIGR